MSTSCRCTDCGTAFARRGTRGPRPLRCRVCDARARRERTRRHRVRRDDVARRRQKRRYDLETKPLQRVLDWAWARGHLDGRLTVDELRRRHADFRRGVQAPVVAAYRAARRGERCRAGFRVLRSIWARSVA